MEPTKLKQKASAGMVWSFAQQFGFQIINFGVSIILARLLLPEEFGLIGMISIFLAVGKLLLDGGFGTSLIRTKDLDQKDYSTVFFVNLFASTIIYFLIFFFAPFISEFFNQPELTKITRVICLTFIISSFSLVQSTRLTKTLAFKTKFFIGLPSLIISSTTGVWMAYNGFGVWSLVWKDLTFALVATIQLWIYSKWTPSWVFDWEKLKYHFGFGYKLTLTGLINTFFENIYKIIIGKYFSAAQLGFYTRAKTMEELPTTNVVSAFNRVAFPLLSQISDDNERLKSVYKRLMVQVVFWITPILIIAGVLATPLFRFLLTEKWLPAVPYFQILVIAGLVYPLHRYNLNICYVKGRSDLVLKLSFLQNGLTVLGAVSAIWFGIYGLLWSIVAVNIIVTIINAHFSGALIGYSLKEQIADVMPVFIVGLGAGVFAYFFDYFLFEKSRDIIRLILPGIFSFSIYMAVSFFTKNSALMEAINLVKPKLKE